MVVDLNYKVYNGRKTTTRNSENERRKKEQREITLKLYKKTIPVYLWYCCYIYITFFYDSNIVI